MNGSKRKYTGQLFVILCLLFSSRAKGQIEVSSGIDAHYPVLLNSSNSNLNYGQFSFGLRAGVAYKPAETQFFPILNLSLGRTRLPLTDFGNNVAALNFNYLNLLLNENYIVHFRESELFIYGGIGFSHLSQKGLKIAGPGGETMESAIDSTKYISSTAPAVNIGFEYNSAGETGKDLYLTIGIDFQYILLLSDRNTYYITVKEQGNVVNHYNTSLTGNVISPGFYIAIHYLLPHSK
jgi:hypothetical protein